MVSSGTGDLNRVDSQLRQFDDANAPLLRSANAAPVIALIAALAFIRCFVPAAVARWRGHPGLRRIASRCALIPLSAISFSPLA